MDRIKWQIQEPYCNVSGCYPDLDLFPSAENFLSEIVRRLTQHVHRVKQDKFPCLQFTSTVMLGPDVHSKPLLAAQVYSPAVSTPTAGIMRLATHDPFGACCSALLLALSAVPFKYHVTTVGAGLLA